MNAAYPEKITPYYNRILKKSLPLKRMLVFSSDELRQIAKETLDPTNELKYRKGKIIHKYKGRALLLLTNRCPAHCRFCFRKRYIVENTDDISDNELAFAIKYLKKNPSVQELIFSGGEPLSLTNQRLQEIISKIKSNLPDLALRLHTRYPIYEPARLLSFMQLINNFKVVVLHINHPDEITRQFADAIGKVRKKFKGILLAQTVLLKKVNDNVAVLEQLVRRLFALGILPYYLHYPDMAMGTSHFRVAIEKAIKIGAALKQRLPGYLVPRLVRELPDKTGGKVEVFMLADYKKFL